MASRALDDDFNAPARGDWWTAAELAELGLPGLPGDKRSINRRAQEERWTSRIGADGELLVRPRQGRGGGVEFHVSLLPPQARLDLSRRGLSGDAPAPQAIDPDIGGWRWYESQSGKVQREAERRLDAIREIELLENAGMTATAAVADVSARKKIGKATLWNWRKLVEGVAVKDRLPALAPRRKGGGKEAEIDPALWTIFKSDYLRPSAPTLTSCYARIEKIAAEKGLSLPSEKTFRRRFEAEVDPAIVKLRREGEEALLRSVPSQRRTVEHMHAMEHVNIDGHRFDVFVKDEDGTVFRPTMVAIQDIYSRKLLAWRIGETESAVLTRLAFADLFRDYGIPKACTLDNGRAFASKWITGGTKSRFRFKIREEEPTGLLTGFGIAIHWAKPYRGQSKPIERAFRDLCDSIAKHPANEGAYTGNKVTAKPENYGSRAVPIADFIALVEEGIAAHNAKLGRRGGVSRGRSFDAVFAESYAGAAIGKASPEQLRRALLAADQVRVDKRTGEIKLYGNRYWSEDCRLLHGKLVTVRFDPDNLHSEIHLYEQDGPFLTTAQIYHDTGFNDVAGAKDAAKREKAWRKQVRDGLKAEQLLSAEAVAAMQARSVSIEPPKPGALRLVRHQGNTAVKMAPAENLNPNIDRNDVMERLAAGVRHLKSVD